MTPKAWLAIFVGYGAGVWFSVLALKKRALLARAASWLNTTGRVLESTEYKDPHRNRTHFRIRYEFHIGQRIEGSTPRVAGEWFWNNKQQKAFVSRFRPGEAVEVYYDPRDPAQNCLDRTDRSGIIVMWVLAIGGTLLASLIVLLRPT